MDPKALFVEIVRATENLPEPLRTHADEVRALEESRFDESYIEFLDEQITLAPRGSEWAEQLKRRRAALLPFCRAALLRGRVRIGSTNYYVQIEPETKIVIHWEEYEMTPAES